jgi:hypothetical protein
MQNKSFQIYGSRPQVWQYLSLGLFLLLLCAWFGYKWASGGDFLTGLVIVGIFGLFSIALAISRYTTVITIKDGKLSLRSAYIHQYVQLDRLVRAERYMQPVGKYPDEILKLEDSDGHTVRINPSDYKLKSFEDLASILHKYIFRTQVDKNFINLHFFVEQGMDVPKTSFWHVIRGSLLYVLLPCIILSALLVLWGFLTKQPAFR